MKVPQRVHDLKCWPEPFAAVLDGRKTVEIRLNDRDYQVGDRLILREYDPQGLGTEVVESRSGRPHLRLTGEGSFTGRACAVDVTHVLPGGQFGLDLDYVALSVRLA